MYKIFSAISHNETEQSVSHLSHVLSATTGVLAFTVHGVVEYEDSYGLLSAALFRSVVHRSPCLEAVQCHCYERSQCFEMGGLKLLDLCHHQGS